MVLSLEKIEFFLDPLYRIHYIQFERGSTGASMASRYLQSNQKDLLLKPENQSPKITR